MKVTHRFLALKAVESRLFLRRVALLAKASGPARGDAWLAAERAANRELADVEEDLLRVRVALQRHAPWR